MNDHILILEPEDYNSDAIKIYKQLGGVHYCFGDPTNYHFKNEVTILVCRLKYYLNSNFLKQFPNVRYIVSPTTGLNHIEILYCDRKQIHIVSLKGETSFLETVRSTSELAFSLILSVVRNIVPSVNSVVHERLWNRDKFRGRELSSMTLGILGIGRIGRHMVEYAKSFGMSILAFDPYINKSQLEIRDLNFCSKRELFSNSDIISVHIDYRPENEKFITRDDFTLMKPGSYFVNTSRGEVISEADLIWALENRILAGAALDVLEDEHNQTNLFQKDIIVYARNHGNLIITPHIGGCTIDGMRKTELFVADKLKKLILDSNYQIQ
jgi:D-3-phosphoglycerate dehydrogenase